MTVLKIDIDIIFDKVMCSSHAKLRNSDQVTVTLTLQQSCKNNNALNITLSLYAKHIYNPCEVFGAIIVILILVHCF